MRVGVLAGAVVLLVAACNRNRATEVEPATTTRVAMPALPGQIDSLWDKAVADFREGHWKSARKIFERLTLSIPPGDPRGPQSHFFLAECLLAQGENLQATREFRKVSDEHPTDSLAPEALLRAGDAYVELWRRPELDPTYGENAQGVYQELLSRYPGTSAAARAQQRIDDLNERFAYKSYKAALFYYRLKAYDSAILYLKDLLSSYPKTSMAGPALIKLVESYRAIGYQEDLHDTCQYLHQYHPDTPGADEVCPRSAGEPAPPHGP